VLTIPVVKIDTSFYWNVTVTLSSVVSVGQAPATSNYDTYNAAKNQLTIPSVIVDGTEFNNVAVVIDKVLSVEGGLQPNAAMVAANNVAAYDFNTGFVSLPVLQIGLSSYNNATAAVGSVISVGPANAAININSLNTANNQITIPLIIVGDRAYNNVVIGLGAITCKAPQVLQSGVCVSTVTPTPPVAAGNLSIYLDSLAPGWADWSWGIAHNLSDSATVHAGSNAIAVNLTSAWGALYLHAGSGISLASHSGVQFWVNGGSTGGQRLQLVVNQNGAQYAFTPNANSWTLVTVPLASVGNPAVLTDLYWQDTSGGPQPTFYLDDIMLVAATGTPVTQPPNKGPALIVNAASGQHQISSDIYGINLLADEALAKELALPVRRWGGNQTTRYNWQNDTYNTGADWFFQNIPEDNPSPSTLPNGSATDQFVEQDRRTGSRTLMTIGARQGSCRLIHAANC
jgi:hypothetical protein